MATQLENGDHPLSLHTDAESLAAPMSPVQDSPGASLTPREATVVFKPIVRLETESTIDSTSASESEPEIKVVVADATTPTQQTISIAVSPEEVVTPAAEKATDADPKTGLAISTNNLDLLFVEKDAGSPGSAHSLSMTEFLDSIPDEDNSPKPKYVILFLKGPFLLMLCLERMNGDGAQTQSKTPLAQCGISQHPFSGKSRTARTPSTRF